MKLLGISFLTLVFTLGFGYSQNSCESGGLVFIEDLALQSALIEELGPVDAFTCEGLKSLTTLRIVNKGIRQLDGLNYAENITTLFLTSNEISDFSVLQSLKKLKLLYIDKNKLEAIPNMSDFESLSNLNVRFNNITKLPDDFNSEKLTVLNLGENLLVDISSIGKAKNLTTLSLRANPITYDNLQPIASLEKLLHLNLDKLNLVDLSQVFPLIYDYEKITILDINENQISDLSLISNFKQLQYFQAANNGISQLDPFFQAPEKLERLYLANNAIKDLSPLSTIPNLKVLYLNNNRITDVDGLSNAKALEKLSLDNNYITNPFPLTTLKELTLLRLNNNRLNSLDGLENFPKLEQLWVNGNFINNVQAFIDETTFGGLPKSIFYITYNCLSSYDRQVFSNSQLSENDNIRVFAGSQRGLNSVECLTGEPKPIFEIKFDLADPIINIGD